MPSETTTAPAVENPADTAIATFPAFLARWTAAPVKDEALVVEAANLAYRMFDETEENGKGPEYGLIAALGGWETSANLDEVAQACAIENLVGEMESVVEG